MRVYVTAAAKADLKEIAAFIKLDNPKRALSFVDDLLDRCKALVDMP